MFIPEEEYKSILRKLPIACVDLLIIYEKKVLLLRRNNEPAKGEYWFPGGRIHKLENINNATIRIAKEETRLNCKFNRIISVEESIFYKNNKIDDDIHTINLCCEMQTNSIASLEIDNLHEGYIWIDNLIPNLHFAIKHPLEILWNIA